MRGVSVKSPWFWMAVLAILGLVYISCFLMGCGGGGPVRSRRLHLSPGGAEYSNGTGGDFVFELMDQLEYPISGGTWWLEGDDIGRLESPEPRAAAIVYCERPGTATLRVQHPEFGKDSVRLIVHDSVDLLEGILGPARVANIGDTLTFEVRDINGNPVSGVTFEWGLPEDQNIGTLTVTDDGVMTVGRVQLTAIGTRDLYIEKENIGSDAVSITSLP